MLNKILHYRVSAGLTRETASAKIGVDADTLRKWELSDVDVPKAKLKKLSMLLRTDSASLLGVHAPRNASVYDFDADPMYDYWGDVAIHFHGPGKPLLLSLSRDAAGELRMRMTEPGAWLVIKSMANQTVLVRKKAISELHMACEAAGFFGRPEEDYEGAPIHMPDPRDWEIVAALQDGDAVGSGDAAEHYQRVRSQIMITDAQYEELIGSGKLAQDDFAEEKAKNDRETSAIFDLASLMTYQLFNGTRRCEHANDSACFADSIEQVLEDQHSDFSGFFAFPVDGESHDVFINTENLDYLSIPSHLLERGLDELADQILEEFGDREN